MLVEDSLGILSVCVLKASADPPAAWLESMRSRSFASMSTVRARAGRRAALMDACFATRGAWSRRRWLQVWKEAPWAVGFYHRMGFSVVGSAPFYFGEQVGDDHIMLRSL